MAPKIKNSTVPTSIQISEAFAKFDRFGLSSEPKAQTISIINPTTGINVISSVIIQLVVDSTGAVNLVSVIAGFSMVICFCGRRIKLNINKRSINFNF